MGRVLPILFNTDMVRAILDGRKTVTRRVVKKKDVDAVLNSPARKGNPDIPDRNFINLFVNAPYEKENFLYVRETYCPDYFDYVTQYGNKHAYKADYDNAVLSSDIPKPKWTPSIHMHKKAARIWLKVTDVGLEKLHDMRLDDFLSEGVCIRPEAFNDPDNACMQARDNFVAVWNDTVPAGQQDLYGWEANPWVWVIEFEQCEKPE